MRFVEPMSEPVTARYMTVEEYLAFEERAPVRHEFVRGRIFSMSGATVAHNIICGNLFSSLHNHMRGSGCHVFQADMKLRLEAANCFYYPDILVTCEPLKGRSILITTPRLIVEVLSPSTKHVDRREKLVAYQELASLNQYVIVHHSRARIEVHQRDASRQWGLEVLSRSDELGLDALPAKLLRVPVSAVYEGVDLPSVVEEEEEEYDLSTSN